MTPHPPSGPETLPHPNLSAAAVSPLAPLSSPVYRMLWLVWLTANLCMWMNDVAAAWLMTELTHDARWIALVQTASTLPVFMLGLASGALADIVDRRKLFIFTQAWVAVTGVLLAVSGLAGLLDARLLLLLVFANGIGLALRWPVMAAVLPDLVPRNQLAAAVGLNGVAMNISRVAGPVIAGALLAATDAAYVFVLNAVLSLASATLLLRWRIEPKIGALPAERFVGAIRVGVQFVRQSPALRVVLLRAFVFFTQSTAVVALLPLVARGHRSGAAGFTVLLSAMGVGAVMAVAVMPKLRQRLSPQQTIEQGTLLHAACTLVIGTVPNFWVALPAMALAGFAWLAVANSLTVSAQFALPDWVRARGMAIYQMSLMGGSAAGAALWGQVTSGIGVQWGLVAAASVAIVLLVLLRGHRVGALADADLTPMRLFEPPEPVLPVTADDGPVMAMVEYRVDEADTEEFLKVMQESRRSRLRLGSMSWGLFRDIEDPGRWVEYFVDASWVEHLRRFERLTGAEAALREQRLAFHHGSEPPKVVRLMGQSLRG